MTTATDYENNCTAVAVAFLANVPTLLWGKPGQGKSKMIKSIGTTYDMHLETVFSSIREPSDFGGLPVVTHDPVEVYLAPPRWARRIAAHDGISIVFLDEISTAPPATQAALLGVTLDRVVGDLELPSSTRILAAANPPDQAAGGWNLAPPMANRFLHLDWKLDAPTVQQGFTIGWPVVTFPDVDEEDAAREIIRAKTIVGAFLASHIESVTALPTSDDASGRAYPTPRSWEMAARLLGYANAGRCNGEVILALLQGSVGLAAAGTFLEYMRVLDLPDPEVVLANPRALVVPRERGDKVYAILGSVWAATANNNTGERWVACGDVFAMVAAAGYADLAFTFGNLWGKGRPANSGAMPSPFATEKLAPIMAEMNMLTTS